LKLLLHVFKRYKSPGCDHIPGEPIQAGGETLRSDIHKSLILSVKGRIARVMEGVYCCTNSQEID
jgi:hypothetical protein